MRSASRPAVKGAFFTPQIVFGQHPPDRAQAHALHALDRQGFAQFGQCDTGLLAHPSHELRLRGRVQAPDRTAVPRLDRHRAAGALVPQALGHKRQAHPKLHHHGVLPRPLKGRRHSLP